MTINNAFPEPVFEQSYQKMKNGIIVTKTERLLPEEIDEIIGRLSQNDDFMRSMEEYARERRTNPSSISREKDVELHSKFIGYIDEELSSRDLSMSYFSHGALRRRRLGE